MPGEKSKKFQCAGILRSVSHWTFLYVLYSQRLYNLELWVSDCKRLVLSVVDAFRSRPSIGALTSLFFPVLTSGGGSGDCCEVPAYSWWFVIEFDEGIRVNLILDNSARRRSPHIRSEVPATRLKVFWDRRDLANLVASSCRMLDLPSSALVTLARLALPSFVILLLRSWSLFRRWSYQESSNLIVSFIALFSASCVPINITIFKILNSALILSPSFVLLLSLFHSP